MKWRSLSRSLSLSEVGGGVLARSIIKRGTSVKSLGMAILCDVANSLFCRRRKRICISHPAELHLAGIWQFKCVQQLRSPGCNTSRSFAVQVCRVSRRSARNSSPNAVSFDERLYDIHHRPAYIVTKVHKERKKS